MSHDPHSTGPTIGQATPDHTAGSPPLSSQSAGGPAGDRPRSQRLAPTPAPPPALPQRIVTARLQLPLISAKHAELVNQGQRNPAWPQQFPTSADVAVISMAASHRFGAGASADDATWGPRYIVRTNGTLTVGTVAFAHPPQPTAGGWEVPLQLNLIASAYGYGVIAELLTALTELTDPLRVSLVGRTSPADAEQLKAFTQAGFTQLRGTDEEGRLIIAHPFPSAN